MLDTALDSIDRVSRRNARSYYRASMTVLYDGSSMMPSSEPAGAPEVSALASRHRLVAETCISMTEPPKTGKIRLQDYEACRYLT